MELKLLLLLIGLCAISCHQAIAEDEQVAVTDQIKESDSKADAVSKTSDEESDSESDDANQAKNNDEKSEEDSDSSEEEDPDALSDETPDEKDLSDKSNSEDTSVAKSQGRSLSLLSRSLSPSVPPPILGKNTSCIREIA